MSNETEISVASLIEPFMSETPEISEDSDTGLWTDRDNLETAGKTLDWGHPSPV